MNQIRKIFWLSLAIKLVLSALLPLTNDEAYYWVWSQHMQLSYYDHPPFVAWLFWLGDFVKWTGGSVRWPGVLLAHATLAIWLLLLKKVLSPEQRLYWLAFALLSPLVGGSGLVITPDVPLMFFYASSLWLYFLWADRPNPSLAFLLGISMGLGFSSKYMIVLLGLSLLPVVAMDHRARRGKMVRVLPWVVAGGMIGSLPVWLWNVMHDFASLKFQAAHGLGGASWKPSWTRDYIFVQIGLIFPPVLYWALRARRGLPSVFHFLAWTPLLFFLATTSGGYVEANWPIVAYPPLFALAVSAYPKNRHSLNVTLGVWGFALAALAAVIFLQPSWAAKSKLREFHHYDRAIERVEKENLFPLYVRSYQMAARMSFETGRPVYKLQGMGGRRDFYDYLPESEPTAPVYYFITLENEELPQEYKRLGHVKTTEDRIDDEFVIMRMEIPGK